MRLKPCYTAIYDPAHAIKYQRIFQLNWRSSFKVKENTTHASTVT